MKENKGLEDDNNYQYLTQYNNMYKSGNDIYHNIAKKAGLSDCVFWIFYAIRLAKTDITQKDICSELYEPKQTINSALKKMEKEEYIYYKETKDKRKTIHLTKKGEVIATQTIDKVINNEILAFSRISKEEKDIFIKVGQMYLEYLKDGFKDNIL